MLLELIIVVSLLIFAYGRLINRFLRLPPGPPPLPLLGNTGLLVEEHMDHLMLRLSKIYGSVFTVWLPGPVVVITDYQIFQDMIVKKGDLFGDREIPARQMEVAYGGTYGLFFCPNESWREQRRFALHSLRDVGFISASMQESAMSYAQQIVDDWKKKGSDGAPVDVTENISYGVCNIMWQLLFGHTLTLGDPLVMTVKDVIQRFIVQFVHPCVSMLAVCPLIEYLDPWLGYPAQTLRTSSRAACLILQKEIDLIEKVLDVDDPPRCYVESFLIEIKRREEKGLSMGSFNRSQLTHAVQELWMAGIETTVSTLRYGIHLLQLNPDAQKRMQKEIDDVCGQRQITMDDQKCLPYCMATIDEIQRVASVSEFNAYRKNKDEVTIAGHTIPAGTSILSQFPSVFIDPTHFERPDYFCPERYINEAGKYVRDPRVTPFSFGKRACLGEGLARMELFIFLTTFVQHCTFSSVTLIPQIVERTRGVARSLEPFNVKITARFSATLITR